MIVVATNVINQCKYILLEWTSSLRARILQSIENRALASNRMLTQLVPQRARMDFLLSCRRQKKIRKESNRVVQLEKDNVLFALLSYRWAKLNLSDPRFCFLRYTSSRQTVKLDDQRKPSKNRWQRETFFKTNSFPSIFRRSHLINRRKCTCAFIPPSCQIYFSNW